MAEYYPLISRAVANMGPSTPEQRRALYERATNALLGQLRASVPPLPEADIERERDALEDAVRRVETEATGGVDRDMYAQVLEEARLAAAMPPREGAPPQPLRGGTRPSSPMPSAPLPDDPASADPRSRPSRADQMRPAEPVPIGSARAFHGADALERPPRPRIVEDETDRFAVVSDDLPERVRPAFSEAGSAAMMERPRAPSPPAQARSRSWLRGAVIGLAIATVVGVTAGIAIKLKHDQADFSPKPDASAPAPEQDAKFQDRLPGEASVRPAPEPPAVQQAAAPTAVPQPGPAPAAPAVPAAPPAAPAPAIGVLQRAILVEEPPEGSADVRQTNGRVLWRLDSVSSGSGDPLDAAVRAEVDMSDAGMKVDILIRRNRDAALPASHTLETKFTATDKAQNGAIRDVGVPEMRQDEAVRGIPLAGISVPVTDNLFLTGLSSLPGDVQRNLDLLKSRNWIMLAVRFGNGRRAILLVEKGSTGSRTLADALQAWQQG